MILRRPQTNMNTKNFSGLMGLLCAIAQAIFYYSDNIDMVYLLTIPLCVSVIFNFEEQWKEKHNIKDETKPASKLPVVGAPLPVA